jgi:alginate O-acetyltransferase complex protein AlgI
MLFNSIFFLFGFLPLFVLGYYAMPHRFRNVYALAGSILFYSWGAPKFVFVLLAAVVVDFYLAQKMATAPTSNKKALLSTGIVINLTILIAFKYLHFFANGVSNYHARFF